MRHHRDWGTTASTADGYPVVCVSWTNSVAFCRWLTERERGAGRLPAGYEYRLPTEAEWEYAARGGPASKGHTYAGSNSADEVAWYNENSDKATHPVGQKEPNELGLYDMSGNVWEWCLDGYDESYYGRSPNVDPANTQAAADRVRRGGSWYGGAGGVRSARRGGGRPDYADSSRGFRACLAPQSEGK
jgi:formylglycine-generating enzyme required for sulfatase activity